MTRPNVSTCGGCGTPIIGDWLLCPACQEPHVGQTSTAVPGDDDVALSLDRLCRAWQVPSAAFLLTTARRCR